MPDSYSWRAADSRPDEPKELKFSQDDRSILWPASERSHESAETEGDIARLLGAMRSSRPDPLRILIRALLLGDGQITLSLDLPSGPLGMTSFGHEPLYLAAIMKDGLCCRATSGSLLTAVRGAALFAGLLRDESLGR